MGLYVKGSEDIEGSSNNVAGWEIPSYHMLIKCSYSIGKHGW